MKTDDLIRQLSQEPPRHSLVAPATAVVLATGAALMCVLLISMVWLRPRADLTATVTGENNAFLLKIAFTFAVVFSALPIVRDLSVPGKRLGAWTLLTVVPFLIVGLLALRESCGVHGPGLTHHADLSSWLECLWRIPALSLPALAILFLTVRRLAPTNLRLSGASIGLVAGGIGAVGYAFHCDHDSMAFIAIFYTLAIFEMAILGAVFGPQVLRWTVLR